MPRDVPLGIVASGQCHAAVIDPASIPMPGDFVTNLRYAICHAGSADTAARRSEDTYGFSPLPARFKIIGGRVWCLSAWRDKASDFTNDMTGIAQGELTRLHRDGRLEPLQRAIGWDELNQSVNPQQQFATGPLPVAAGRIPHRKAFTIRRNLERGAQNPVRGCVDFLAAGPDALRIVTLTNYPVIATAVAGPVVDDGPDHLLDYGDCTGDPKGWAWTLAAWTYTGGFDKYGRWIPKAWTRNWVATAPFTDNFYAFEIAGKQYFVTAPGAVYVARPDPTTAARKIAPLWAAPKWPVTAALHDADRNRTVCFARKAEKGNIHHAYFELADPPVATSYDPATLKPNAIDGPLGNLVKLAQLLPPVPAAKRP